MGVYAQFLNFGFWFVFFCQMRGRQKFVKN